MGRGIEFEPARCFGGLNLVGMNTGVVTSRRSAVYGTAAKQARAPCTPPFVPRARQGGQRGLVARSSVATAIVRVVTVRRRIVVRFRGRFSLAPIVQSLR